eukprot:jgi/Ulvmu1/9425/UM051_0053.1
MAEPFWIYLLIPVLSALVGYFTNVLAVWMTFNPLEFWPVEVLRVDGQPWGLFGWQGIIPTKAGVMTAMLYDAFMQKVLDIEEIFSRIDPQKVSELTAAEMKETTRTLVDRVARAKLPDVWTALSPEVRGEVTQHAQSESGAYVTLLMEALQREILDVVDLRGNMVRIVMEDKTILNDMFLTTGGKEFTFVRRSGLYFGFLFGLIQTLVYFFYKGKWVLPVAGFLVGYGTNWVALKLIFEPAHPCHFGCFTLQGLFLKRQQEAAVVIAENSQRFFLRQPLLWTEILHGTYRDRWERLLRRVTERFMRKRATRGAVERIATGALIGEDHLQHIVQLATEHINEALPEILPRTYDYMDKAMRLEETIRVKLQAMSPAEFIGILRPAFQADELKLILVGGILGAAAGALQQFAMFDLL